MNLDLKGKNALVCGASQGIGKAVAVELAKLGCSVTVVARDEEKLKAVVSVLDRSVSQDHDFISVDFASAANVRQRIEKYIGETEKNFHILINNSGGPNPGPVAEAKEEDFISAFQQHLLCNHILAQLLIPGMKKENYGRIINIISTSVKQPLNDLGVSNTIRGAVANWSKTLANEVAKFAITVNNVLPGATNTERLKQIISDKSKKTGRSKDEILIAMKANIPMQRIGEAEEIAAAIAFLASPAASYITGINLPADGGRTSSL